MSTALDVLGALRLSDGRRWIDAALDWQLADARAVIEGERPYHLLTRARGSSKTTDLAAVALALLLAAPDVDRFYWLAADQAQGTLAIDAIAGFVGRTPELQSAVDVQARRVVVRRTGASLEVLAADAPGAWGLLPAAVFMDELANWTDGPAARRLSDAATSAVAKRRDARLVVITTASSPDHFAFRLVEHARSSPLWRVHERPGPAPWMDEARLAEQRARLPESVYLQLFENQWVASEGAFLDPAVVDAAFVLPGPQVGRASGTWGHVAGLDLGSRNDATVLAIGHMEGAAVHLDRMLSWQGSRLRPVNFAEVESAILAAHERFRFRLSLDPWQGLDLAQRLRARGITADEYAFSQGSKQRLAATLLSTLNAGTLRLYGAPGLRDELLALRLKQSASGAWAFDHAAGRHDDRATALALMAVAALDRPVGTVKRTSYLDGPRYRNTPPVIERNGLRLQGHKYVDRPPRGSERNA